MVATGIDVAELLAQATLAEKKELLRAAVRDAFARVGTSVVVKVLDADGKLIGYLVPPRVKTELPLLEDCPEEFEAEMKRRMADPGEIMTVAEFDASIQAEFGPFECDIPLPTSHHANGKTRTK